MKKNSVNIAVLVSGGGTNLQALINAQKKGILHSGKIVLVISSKPDAYAIVRARKNDIPVAVVEKKVLGQSGMENRISELLEQSTLAPIFNNGNLILSIMNGRL